MREHIVDLAGDPGALVQRRRLGLGHPGSPLLLEEPLGAAAGLGIQSEHVSRKAETRCGHRRRHPAVGVDGGVGGQRDGRGGNARRERQPLQSRDSAAAPQDHGRHTGTGLLRPEGRRHQQRHEPQGRPEPMLQAGPEECPPGPGAADDAQQADHDFPGPEPAVGEGAPEQEGQHQNADGPGDGRPGAGAAPCRESLPGRPARPGSAGHTRSFHASGDGMPSAAPPYAGRTWRARHVSTPPRTKSVTARAVSRAALP